MEAPNTDDPLILAVWRLYEAGIDTPNLDAGLLFCKVKGCTKTEWMANPGVPLSPSQKSDFQALITRREAREPLPHLLGHWEFMGHAYEVGPQALIPRPETEFLVEAVVERLRDQVLLTGLTPRRPSLQGKGEPNDADDCELSHPSPRGRGAGGEARVRHLALESRVRGVTETATQLPSTGLTPRPPSLPGKGEPNDADGCELNHPSPRGRGAGGEARVPDQVLDIGTGTGCVAIELALRLPSAFVTSVDISPDALDLARRNVAKFEVADRVALRHARFPDDVCASGPFDAIVSNPPYIPSDEVDRLEPELTRYEPRAALDGGPDGLDVIRALISESGALLHPGGLLAMEIGHDQADRVTSLLQSAGWTEVEIVQDLAGIYRVVLARKPT